MAAPIVPTLYLHGRDDGCFTYAFARWIPDVLPPGSQTTAVDRAGHFLHLERPDIVGDLIVEFLGAPS